VRNFAHLLLGIGIEVLIYLAVIKQVYLTVPSGLRSQDSKTKDGDRCRSWLGITNSILDLTILITISRNPGVCTLVSYPVLALCCHGLCHRVRLWAWKVEAWLARAKHGHLFQFFFIYSLDSDRSRRLL